MRLLQPDGALSVQGGLHLPAARLWLDGNTRQGIAFVAQHDGLRRRRSRILCSTGVASLLGSGGAAPLAVPYGRPFQLGNLAVELLPAGSSAGAAMLRTRVGDATYLFAGAARPDALPTAEALDLRPADVLVLDAKLAETHLLSVAGLGQTVQQGLGLAASGGLLWLVDSPTLALDVLALAGTAQVRVAPSLALLARRFIRGGGALPTARGLGIRRPSDALCLWPADDLGRLPQAWRDLPRWLLGEDVGPPVLDRLGCQRGVPFARRASGEQLDALALASGAAHVAAHGAGAAALCARLQGRGVSCSVLAQPQLRLV